MLYPALLWAHALLPLQRVEVYSAFLLAQSSTLRSFVRHPVAVTAPVTFTIAQRHNAIEGDWNMRRRPNILWICTDEQRWDTIHALGNPHIHTPHVDRLVHEGVAFTHTFCQSPICTASRSSFLTGMYPSSVHGCCNGNERCFGLAAVITALVRFIRSQLPNSSPPPHIRRQNEHRSENKVTGDGTREYHGKRRARFHLRPTVSWSGQFAI